MDFYAQVTLGDNLTPNCLYEGPTGICICTGPVPQLSVPNTRCKRTWLCSIVDRDIDTSFAPPSATVVIKDDRKLIAGRSVINGTLTHGYICDSLPDGIHILAATDCVGTDAVCNREKGIPIAPDYPLVIPIMHPKYLKTLPYLPFRMVDLREVSEVTISLNEYEWINLDSTLIDNLHDMGIWMLPLVFLPKRVHTLSVTWKEGQSRSQDSTYMLWDPQLMYDESKYNKGGGWVLAHVEPPFTNCDYFMYFPGELQGCKKYYPVCRYNIKVSEYLGTGVYKKSIYAHY